MVKLYIPPANAEDFVLAFLQMARCVASAFKCKITIRADYADGTFIVHESDHRAKVKGAQR